MAPPTGWHARVAPPTTLTSGTVRKGTDRKRIVAVMYFSILPICLDIAASPPIAAILIDMYFQSSLPIGLIQINTAGEILYFQPEIRKGLNSRPYPLVGQNLFSMLLSLDPTRDAEEKLKHFINSRESLISVDCQFRSFDGLAPVKMVVARIPPHRDGPATDVIIINFKMNQAAEGLSRERLDTRTMAAGTFENETGPLSTDLDGGPPDLPPS